MPRLLTLCGSIRPDSSNSRLLRVAAGFLPPNFLVDHYAALASLPPFDPAMDLDPGPAVLDLRKRVKEACAVLIATPEYAHGIPGSLKNALDWMVGSGELYHKPVGVIVASASDGAYAKDALVEVLRTMGAETPSEMALGIAGIKSKLPAEGEPSPALLKDIEGLIRALSLLAQRA